MELANLFTVKLDILHTCPIRDSEADGQARHNVIDCFDARQWITQRKSKNARCRGSFGVHPSPAGGADTLDLT